MYCNNLCLMDAVIRSRPLVSICICYCVWTDPLPNSLLQLNRLKPIHFSCTTTTGGMNALTNYPALTLFLSSAIKTTSFRHICLCFENDTSDQIVEIFQTIPLTLLEQFQWHLVNLCLNTTMLNRQFYSDTENALFIYVLSEMRLQFPFYSYLVRHVSRMHLFIVLMAIGTQFDMRSVVPLKGDMIFRNGIVAVIWPHHYTNPETVVYVWNTLHFYRMTQAEFIHGSSPWSKDFRREPPQIADFKCLQAYVDQRPPETFIVKACGGRKMTGSLLKIISLLANHTRIPLNLQMYRRHNFNNIWNANSTACDRAIDVQDHLKDEFRDREIMPYESNVTKPLLTLTMFEIQNESCSHPFGRVDYRIAVPNRPIRDWNLAHGQNNILILRLWLISVGILTVVRHVTLRIMRRSKDDGYSISESLIWIAARSLGGPLFAVQSSVRTEQMFTGFVTVFGFFGGTLCMGYLFDEFTDIRYTQPVMTIEEFWKSDLIMLTLNYIPLQTRLDIAHM